MDGTDRTLWRGVRNCALIAILALAAASCAGNNSLLPAEDSQAAASFTSYDQVVDAFEQIVPGRTQAEDLAHIGFDARTGNVDVLSYLGIQDRFLPRDSFRFERLDPAVQACILSESGCTGYVFHPSHTATKRIGNPALDLLGFRRITRNEHWSAEILLLVQNGVVTHKVFSGNPRTETVEDKEQPLGPLQDLGGVLAHGVGATVNY